MPTSPTPEELSRLERMRNLSLQMEDAFQSMAVSMAQFAKTHKETTDEDLPANVLLTKELVKSYNSLSKKAFDLADNTERLTNGSIRSKDILKQINDIEKEKVLNARKYEILQTRGVNLTQEELRIQADAIENSNLQLKILKEQLAESQKIEKTAGLTSKIFEGIKNIPFVNKLVDAEKITEDIYDNSAKTKNTWSAFGAGLSSTLGQVGKKLTDPLILLGAQVAIFTKLFKLAKDLDQTLVDTSRTLGISKDASEELYNSYAKYAAKAGDSFLNNQMLLETQMKLNKELGTSVAFGAENLEGAARLSHFYGLSEQSSAKMVELATEQGRNSLDILRSTSKTYTLQKAQLGGTMSLNKVLDKVANVSDDIFIRFKGNPEAIAKAVMQADRLGLELEQVNKIGESLLDFESSIENELKAELLTGKAINLEKARAAALSGDTAKLTTEIAKQVGSIHQFEKMNVIQRKAYAEAFGMNVQEMSSMLRKREFEAKLSEDAKKSATATLEFAAKHNLKLDDALKAQYEQKSLAEEQHEVFRNLNNMIGNLTKGPMGAFVKMINSALHGVQGMIDSLNSLTGGTLGNALGAAILGAPMLLVAIKGITGLFSGGFGKGSLFQRGTYPNPMITQSKDGGIGGEGGLADSVGDLGGKGGKRSVGSRMKRGMVSKFGAKGTRALMRMGPGLATAALGIGADLVAGQMDEGTGKDTVSGIGTTAEYAGVGAMIGSIIPGLGTVVGGVLGGTFGAVKALFDAESSRREREEKAKQQQEEQQKATNDLMRQFLDRPVQLNVGGKTILDFNTASNLYGTQQSSFN